MQPIELSSDSSKDQSDDDFQDTPAPFIRQIGQKVISLFLISNPRGYLQPKWLKSFEFVEI
jgi:hypothetical protein